MLEETANGAAFRDRGAIFEDQDRDLREWRQLAVFRRFVFAFHDRDFDNLDRVQFAFGLEEIERAFRIDGLWGVIELHEAFPVVDV